MVTNEYHYWQNHHKVEKCPCYMRGKISQECSVCDNRYRGHSQTRTMENSIKAANYNMVMLVNKFTTYEATFFVINVTGIWND